MSASASPLELLGPSLGERPILRLADLAARLERNEAQLWSMGSAAIYSEVAEYESTGERVFECGPAGGDLEEIKQMIPMLMQVAESWDCTQIIVQGGRPGWARLLEKYGFETQIVMRKILK